MKTPSSPKGENDTALPAHKMKGEHSVASMRGYGKPPYWESQYDQLVATYSGLPSPSNDNRMQKPKAKKGDFRDQRKAKRITHGMLTTPWHRTAITEWLGIYARIPQNENLTSWGKDKKKPPSTNSGEEGGLVCV